MASDTDIKKAKTRTRPSRLGGPLGVFSSPLTGIIFLANTIGLIVLVVGVFYFGEIRKGLTSARTETLVTQGQIITSLVENKATRGIPTPKLLVADVPAAFQDFAVPSDIRVRVYDPNGNLIPGADTKDVDQVVHVRGLETVNMATSDEVDAAREVIVDRDLSPNETPTETLAEEIAAVMAHARQFTNERLDSSGDRVISVSMPIQHVQAVLGVVNIQAKGVEDIVARERQALLPFALLAAAVTLISSTLLAFSIVRPIRRLAMVAESVRTDGPKRHKIPHQRRRDEVGHLSRSFAAMTEALGERMDAIERFAADVSHELKNPLTSLRAGVDMLPKAHGAAQQSKTIGLIKSDVTRIDRLITDISKASRVDAEIAREEVQSVDLGDFLFQLVESYRAIRKVSEPDIIFESFRDVRSGPVSAVEDSLSQVFRNLIDNARTFSPPDAPVRVRLNYANGDGRPMALAHVEDSGPGIPPDNLDRIFERFYSERPEGAKFGDHSGLGLAIAKQIIEAHHGQIWASNIETLEGGVAGARFTIALPVRA